MSRTCPPFWRSRDENERPPVPALRLEATHAEEPSHGSGDGLDSEGDDASPLPSADETNLTNDADAFFRAPEGALIPVELLDVADAFFRAPEGALNVVVSPPDPMEVGPGQGQIIQGLVINPRFDQHSSANVPAITIPNRGRRQPDQGTMRVARE